MHNPSGVRRLYRKRTNRVVAGLLGGLGDYMGIDPVLLRLIGVIVIIFTGIIPGLIAYLLGAIVVPLEPLNHGA